MANWTSEFKVGIFAILAFFALSYMFVVLSPSVSGGDRVEFYTKIKDAAGLIPKSQVKTNGVVIGQVEKINLEADGTRITVKLDRAVKIPVDSKTEVRSKGLLGDVFVEVIRAADQGTYVPPGGYIPHSRESVDMQAIMKTVAGISLDVKKITGALASASEDGGKSKIKNILTNVEEASTSMRNMFKQNEQAVGTLISNLNKSMKSLREAVQANGKNRLDSIFESTDGTMSNLKTSSDDLASVMSTIRAGEGTIGKLVSDSSTIDEIEGTLRDVRDLVAPIRRVQASIDWHSEGGVEFEENIRNYFSLKLQPKPDKYYLIGVVDMGTRQRSIKVDNEVVAAGSGGGTITTTESESEEFDRFRFNVQFAKRWGSLGMRFGVFESAGGVGIDYYAFRDRFRYSLDMFDFDVRKKDLRKWGNFKTYATFTLWNHLYGVAGINDITQFDSNEDLFSSKADYFIGMGLKFTDDDFKSLLGLFASAAGAN